MEPEKVRGYLAIIIPTGVFLVAAIITLAPILIGSEPDLESLKSWSLLWTGILGTILGYYFGKKS